MTHKHTFLTLIFYLFIVIVLNAEEGHIKFSNKYFKSIKTNDFEMFKNLHCSSIIENTHQMYLHKLFENEKLVFSKHRVKNPKYILEEKSGVKIIIVIWDGGGTTLYTKEDKDKGYRICWSPKKKLLMKNHLKEDSKKIDIKIAYKRLEGKWEIDGTETLKNLAQNLSSEETEKIKEKIKMMQGKFYLIFTPRKQMSMVSDKMKEKWLFKFTIESAIKNEFIITNDFELPFNFYKIRFLTQNSIVYESRKKDKPMNYFVWKKILKKAI